MRRLGFWLALAGGLTLALSALLVALDLFDVRNTVPLSDSYDWLAFVGAVFGGIAGGLFTFGGVYLTLQQQRQSDANRELADKTRDSEIRDAERLRNRLSIMPLLEFALSYDPDDFDDSKLLPTDPTLTIFTIDGGVPHAPSTMDFLFDIVVNNVGLGHALLTNAHFDVRDNKDRPIQKYERLYSNFLIKTDSRRDLRYSFHAPREAKRFADDPSQFVYGIVVTLLFQDLLGNRYEQVLRGCITKNLYAGEDPVTGGRPSCTLFEVSAARLAD